jgi:hypothetical protein
MFLAGKQSSRILTALGLSAAVFATDKAEALEFSGKVGVEARVFPQSAFDSRQSDADFSFFVAPEIYRDLSNGSARLVFSPYGRFDENDSRRSHLDIRELYFEKIWSSWELSVGVKQIFWGVTETQHLVDFVNQTDFIENFDGEDKLGQPMAHLTHIGKWGIVEAFALPYFRQRTFAGIDGRLRGPLPIDTDNPVYESRAEEYNFDWALSWSHTFGDLDLGLSHFSGTNRAPGFLPTLDPTGQLLLRPFYPQTERTGLTLQWTAETILWKLEAVSEETLSERSFSAVGGFERTFVGILGSAYDLGALVEYHYDDRGNRAPLPFENDLFVGARLALNDVQSTVALAGAVVDLDNQSTAIFLEASRRVGQTLTIELEWRGFINVPPDDRLYPFSRDDHALISIQRYF